MLILDRKCAIWLGLNIHPNWCASIIQQLFLKTNFFKWLWISSSWVIALNVDIGFDRWALTATLRIKFWSGNTRASLRWRSWRGIPIVCFIWPCLPMANLSSPVPVMKRSASGASSAKLDLKRYPPLKHNISFWGLLTPLPVPFIKAIVTLSLFQRSKYPISLLSSQSNLNDLFSFQIGNAVGAESIHQSPVGRNLSTSPRQFSFSPASPLPYPPPPTPLFWL